MEIALKSFFPAFDQYRKNIRTGCDNPSCHNTQLMRMIPGGRAGIQAGERWYCSVDCFAGGSVPLLGELSRNRFAERRRHPRMSLALTLVAKGYLSPEALRFAHSQCESGCESVEAVLVRLGMVDEQQLAAARAVQWGYPLLGKDRVGQPVQSDVPEVLLEYFSAVPFEFSARAKRIVLGFVFQVEYSLLECIEAVTGCAVVPCMISPSQYAEQIKQVSAVCDGRSMLVDYPGSAWQMSRTLGQQAVEIGAKSVTFAHCRRFVWSRLTGKRGKMDVVFRMDEPPCAEKMQDSDKFKELSSYSA